MLGSANSRQPPAWTCLLAAGTKAQWFQSWRTSCRKLVWNLILGVEESSGRLLAKEGAGKKCHHISPPDLVEAFLAWGSPFHAPAWQGWPKPFPSCPWQGPAASVHLMKPSGCDTISSKLGREPLPGSSKGKRERSDK